MTALRRCDPRFRARSVRSPSPLAGCAGLAVGPRSCGAAGASSSHWLFWMFIAVLAASVLAVMMALVVALRAPRRRAPTRSRSTRRRERRTHRRRRALVGVDRSSTVLVADAGLELRHRPRDRSFARRGAGGHDRGHRPPVVVGGPLRGPDAEPQLHDRQRDPHPGRPAGAGQARRRADVIHSFWVPEPHGKQDLIPGQRERHLASAPTGPASIAASAPSSAATSTRTWRFLVVAEPPADFERWRDRADRSRRAADRPDAQQRGQQVFLVAAPASMCHTIRGTPAGGTRRPRPDARRRAAARSPPARCQHAAATSPRWIVDPQRHQAGRRHAADRSSTPRRPQRARSPIWRA